MTATSHASPALLDTAVRELIDEHAALESLLAGHLDRVIAGDFDAALHRFDAFAASLRAHLAREEAVLFPLLATHPSPRWKVAVYAAEHDRLRLLLSRQRHRLARAAAAPPAEPAAQRARSLALLDAIHSLRHVLEHHQQREDEGLFRDVIG